MSAPAPFLRWAGGKRQLLGSILPVLPAPAAPRGRFFEPFVGGGAVMFALGDPGSAGFVPGSRLVINDINPELIVTYTAVRDELELLLTHLERLARHTTKAAYERVKKSRPRDPVRRAARFIYLNKTCFNGLWRVNGSGEFNVPWGQLKNPQVFVPDLLAACSARLQGAQIRCVPVTTALGDARAGDVVYLDPPYLPLSASASFSKYARHDFGVLDHYALAGAVRGLSDRGVKVLLSNSDTELTRSIYGSEVSLWQLRAGRSISASSASRGSVHEVLGANYPVSAPPAQLTALSSAARTRPLPPSNPAP